MALAISTAEPSLLASETAEGPPGLTATAAPLIADPRLHPVLKLLVQRMW